MFVNGLPLAVFELPALSVFNEILVVSDGLEARIGTLSSNRERFLPWRTVEGEELATATLSQDGRAVGSLSYGPRVRRRRFRAVVAVDDKSLNFQALSEESDREAPRDPALGRRGGDASEQIWPAFGAEVTSSRHNRWR